MIAVWPEVSIALHLSGDRVAAEQSRPASACHQQRRAPRWGAKTPFFVQAYLPLPEGREDV